MTDYSELIVTAFKMGYEEAKEQARERIAVLEAALKPFDERLKVLEETRAAAKYAASTDVDIVHLRAARAALNGEK